MNQKLRSKCSKPNTPEGYDACMSDEIAEVNRLHGCCTYESCCGHGGRPPRIFVMVSAEAALKRLAKHAMKHNETLEVTYNETFDEIDYILEGEKKCPQSK